MASVGSSSPPESPPSLNVLIIGAGIAGLTAAIALGKQGHHVVVCTLPLPPALDFLLRFLLKKIFLLPDIGKVSLCKRDGCGYSSAPELYSPAEVDGH